MKFARFSLLSAVLGAAVAFSGASAQQCGCTTTITVSLGVTGPSGSPMAPGLPPAPAPPMMTPAVQPPMPSMTTMPMPPPPMASPMNPAGMQPPLSPGDQSSTGQVIVTAINGVADASHQFDLFIQPLDGNPLTSIQVASQAPIKFGQLTQMAVKATAMLSSVKGTITAQDALDAIVAALVNFVKVHQNLLQTIIGKKGLIAKFGFAEPVRVALVTLEQAVDSFAFALIGVIPSRQNDAMVQKASLDQSLQATIKVYSS